MYSSFFVLIYIVVIRSQVTKSFDSKSVRNCTEKHSSVSKCVRFDCDGSSEGVNFWKYNDENIYINNNIITSAVEDFELYSNYSLVIKNVSIDHEGIYQCIRNSVEVAGYCLNVRVYPKLKISVTGHDTDVVQFENNEELVVRCQAIGSRPATNLTWRVNGRLVNATEIVQVHAFDNRTFDTDSTLRFYPQGANGTVTCSDAQQQVEEVKITYFKFVSPKRLSLFVDREDVVKSVTVYYGQSYNVTCVARAARPPVTLTFIINNVTLSPSKAKASTVPRDDNPDNVTYDSWIEVEYKPTEGHHTFTCVSSGDEPHQEMRTSITVHVLAYEESFEDISDEGFPVLPLMSSALVVTILLILSTISCLIWRRKVRGAERSGNFGVTVARLDEQSLSRKDDSTKTDHESSESSNIPRLTAKEKSKGRGRKVKRTMEDAEGREEILTTVPSPTPSPPSAEAPRSQTKPKKARVLSNLTDIEQEEVALFPERNGYIYNKGGPTTPLLPRKIRQSIWEVMPKQGASGDFVPWFPIERDISEMGPKEGNCEEDPSVIASPKTPTSEGSVKETAFTYEFALPPQMQLQTETKPEYQYQHPPKLELPDVPYVERSSRYENPCVAEGVYYSDLKDEVSVGRLFHRQEMCLILSIKAGTVHNRWMGSIAVTNGMTKCVFVSTVTEHILRTREIQWDIYVKRILELPQSNSLTNTEGICIDGAQLYLVQEHFTCVSLDSHIRSNRREAGDGTSYTTFTSSDIRKWVVDILKGMEIAHSYGLLHPGLSTKKILFTNDNVLKLYDFCLSDDAQRKVLLLKGKMSCSLNQLAPEALLRNEYTVTSDVWSMAVVIWELLTATSPFPEDSQVLLNRNGSLFHGSWPSKYADLRNNYVFDCWRQDCSIRPTMRQLRFSFDEDNESSERNVLTEGSEIGISEQYVPMKGIIQGQKYEETTSVQIKKATPKGEGMTIERKLKEVTQDENKKSNSV